MRASASSQLNPENEPEFTRTPLCVLNGAAYGTGFALCLPDGDVGECSDTTALVKALIALLEPR